MITELQLKYIEQLLIDCKLWEPRVGRNNWLSLEVKRPIKFLDELTVKEASVVINRLKEIKENEREIERNRRLERNLDNY